MQDIHVNKTKTTNKLEQNQQMTPTASQQTANTTNWHFNFSASPHCSRPSAQVGVGSAKQVQTFREYTNIKEKGSGGCFLLINLNTAHQMSIT